MKSLFDWMLVGPRVNVTPLESLIATAFGNGEQGSLYVPQPVIGGQQVLFQDYQMTIPVTAPGDPVGAMLDISGNGNHATQPVSANRPIYQTDGNKHWLYFDGVSTHLLIDSPILGLMLQGSGYVAQVAVNIPQQSDKRLLAEGNSSTGTTGLLHAPLQTGLDGISLAAFMRKTNNEILLTQSQTAYGSPFTTPPQPHVITASVAPEGLRHAVDGVYGPLRGTVFTSMGIGDRMAIGALVRGSVSSVIEGSVYGLAVSEHSESQVMQYLASLAGVTLT